MFKEKEKIQEKIFVQHIFHCPDINPLITLNTIVMIDDNGNEFTWNTTSDKYPEQGEVSIMSATVAKVNYGKHNWDCDSYRVSNCRFKKCE